MAKTNQMLVTTILERLGLLGRAARRISNAILMTMMVGGMLFGVGGLSLVLGNDD